MKVDRSATVLAFLVTGLLTAACGVSSSSGNRPQATPTLQTVASVVPAMQAAVKQAASVRMAGTWLEGSKQLTFDIIFQVRPGPTVTGRAGIWGA